MRLPSARSISTKADRSTHFIRRRETESSELVLQTFNFFELHFFIKTSRTSSFQKYFKETFVQPPPSQCDQMIKFSCSIFGHCQQIKIAQQQKLGQNVFLAQMLNTKLLQLAPQTVKISCSGGVSQNLVTLQSLVQYIFSNCV